MIWLKYLNLKVNEMVWKFLIDFLNFFFYTKTSRLYSGTSKFYIWLRIMLRTFSEEPLLQLMVRSGSEISQDKQDKTIKTSSRTPHWISKISRWKILFPTDNFPSEHKMEEKLWMRTAREFSTKLFHFCFVSALLKILQRFQAFNSAEFRGTEI